MQRWEYCQVQVKHTEEDASGVSIHKLVGVVAFAPWSNAIAAGDHFLEVFTELGRQGWEMCGQVVDLAYQIPGEKDRVSYAYIYFFKRPLGG